MEMSRLTHYISFPGRVSDDLFLISNSRGERSEWLMVLYINTNENFNITSSVHFIAQTKQILEYLSFANGPGSSVGIATGYGLDGPGIESK